MCGFVGGTDPSWDYTAALASIEHRGPDDAGYYSDEPNGTHFGLRRLSIIDLTSGTQPIHNEDKTVWVIFNGEIFNFQIF